MGTLTKSLIAVAMLYLVQPAVQAYPELTVVSFSTGKPIYREHMNRLEEGCRRWSVESSMDTFPLMPGDKSLVDVSSVVSSLDGIAGLVAGKGLLSGTWPLQYIHSFKPLFMWCVIYIGAHSCFLDHACLRCFKLVFVCIYFSGLNYCSFEDRSCGLTAI